MWDQSKCILSFAMMDSQYFDFERLHKDQLESSGVPQKLWKVCQGSSNEQLYLIQKCWLNNKLKLMYQYHPYQDLYKKLKSETFDISDKAGLSTDPDLPIASPYELVLTAESLEKESDIFLIDHAWTTSVAEGLEQLEKVPGLLERVKKLVGAEAKTDVDSDDDEEREDTKDLKVRISLVMSQADVDEARARKLLKDFNGEVIEAIAVSTIQVAITNLSFVAFHTEWGFFSCSFP